MRTSSLAAYTQRHLQALSLAALTLLLPGCFYSTPYFSSDQESVSVKGCTFESTIYVYSIAGQSRALDKRYTGWSGACVDGEMSGPGYLGIANGEIHYQEFSVIRPGKPRKYFIAQGTYEGRDYATYTKQFFGALKRNEDKFEMPLSEAECLAIEDCKSVHDAYFARISDAQKALANASSAEAARQMKLGIVQQNQNDEVSRQQIERINQRVDDEVRAEKQRLRAEQAAERANSPDTTGTLLSGLAGVAAAADPAHANAYNALGAGANGNLAAAGQSLSAPQSCQTTKKSVKDAIRECNCENGKVSQKPVEDGTVVGCRVSPELVWSCRFFNDGHAPQCGVQ